MPPWEIRVLRETDVGRIAEIDRAELVDVEYTVEAGRLEQRPATFDEVPRWDPHGEGHHSVAALVAFIEPVVAAGAALQPVDSRGAPDRQR